MCSNLYIYIYIYIIFITTGFHLRTPHSPGFSRRSCNGSLAASLVQWLAWPMRSLGGNYWQRRVTRVTSVDGLPGCAHHFEVVKSTIQLYEAPGMCKWSAPMLAPLLTVLWFNQSTSQGCVLRFGAPKSSKVLEVTRNLGGWFLGLPYFWDIQHANRFAPFAFLGWILQDMSAEMLPTPAKSGRSQMLKMLPMRRDTFARSSTIFGLCSTGSTDWLLEFDCPATKSWNNIAPPIGRFRRSLPIGALGVQKGIKLWDQTCFLHIRLRFQ